MVLANPVHVIFSLGMEYDSVCVAVTFGKTISPRKMSKRSFDLI